MLKDSSIIKNMVETFGLSKTKHICLTRFVMRSGHTEVYNCPIEEAEDILRLASETRKIDNAYMQTKANERKIYSTLMDEYDDMEKISGSSWNPDRNPIKMIAA
jgi:hypothetical protein